MKQQCLRQRRVDKEIMWLLMPLLLLFASSSAQEEYVLGRSTRRQIPRAGIISFGRMVTPVSSFSSYRIDNDEDEQQRLQSNAYRPWKVQPERREPGATSLTTKLVVANVAMYALQCLFPSITRWGVKLSDRILAGRELHRLVTPMFLHGGVAHLMTNTYSLRSVGPDVERLFGGGRFLATYLVSGLTGNMLSTLRSPNPSLGASGAVFGTVAAYYVFLNRNRNLFGRQGDAMSEGLMSTIALNLVVGALVPMVDNWGHIGGAIGGAAMAYYFGPRLCLVGLPNGGRALVDNPIVRLPRAIESIPEKFDNRFSKMKRRMQVERYKADLPEKPWRKPTQKIPKAVPNRSIKPVL